jgi:hypothetical protein
MIKDHPDIFKVPAAVFQDPSLNSQFTGLLKEVLTDCRSNIKQKVYLFPLMEKFPLTSSSARRIARSYQRPLTSSEHY